MNRSSGLRKLCLNLVSFGILFLTTGILYSDSRFSPFEHSISALFQDIDGCILIMDLESGVLDYQYNPEIAFKECHPPGSVFKMVTALTAFREMDDPFSFLTEETGLDRFTNLLSTPQNEHAARSVRVAVSESPSYEVSVLNVDEVIAQNPSWFTPYEGMTLSEFGAKLFDDSK